MKLVYRTNSASCEEILRHLERCDSDYKPPLSTRVDLLSYADKIHSRAVSFEAWDRDANLLVGMINAYLNDTRTQTGFITNVSVLREYRGLGLASALLAMCLEYARKNGFTSIELEVAPNNAPAIKLYSRAGFKAVTMKGDNLIMRYAIADRENRQAE
jgi:ribosomal protein S18 acetylase RimI-like enzyme